MSSPDATVDELDAVAAHIEVVDGVLGQVLDLEDRVRQARQSLEFARTSLKYARGFHLAAKGGG